MNGVTNPKPVSKQQRDSISAWLTPDRLSRLNHIRERSGVLVVTHEQGVALLLHMSPEALVEVKNRIE